MCNGPLWNKILLFALPLMASSILQLLFNAADVVVVGRYAGKEALAAVGSNSALINLLINLFVGLSVGTNVVVARDLGAGRHDNVSRSVHSSVTLALISGVGMAVFGVVMVRQLLEWMSSPTDVIDLATVYLRIYFLGMPANMLYNFGAAILRAQGDTQRPLYFLTAAGIVNVILNLCFVIGLGMDVDGVALATIISQYISAALVLRCLMRETGPLRLELSKLRLDWPVVRRILQVGLPAGFQGIVFSLSNVVIQSALNSFNDAALVAGSAASSNIENFVYAAMNSFYQTALTFCGQNYGAAKCKRVDRTLFLCVTFSMTTGLVLGNLAYLRPNYAKVVADLCKEQGGMPFLTDCNTLYPGSRKNALEHLTCAQLNGFWPMTTGCQVIIADGLRGTDEAEVPVPNGEYCIFGIMSEI